MGYKVRTRDLVSYREEVSCMTGCPINTDCGMYVQQIAKGDFEAGYLTARSPNPFASSCGRVCAAPCEDNCRRGKVDQPISIRSLKKFLTEQYGPESSKPETLKRLLGGEKPASHFHSMHASALKTTAPQSTGGKKVAVVGSGPAGLSCAHDLAILGYEVTVFDNFEKGGGMMRYGIPSYRLPDKVLDSEIEVIKSMGVTINQNQSVKSIDELKSQGFSAVFIGTGVTLGRKIPIEGSDYKGTLTALEFLIDANKGITTEIKKRVLVIGGGLVALDAAREARRQILQKAGTDSLKKAGAEVHCAALESMTEMPSAKSVSGLQELEETVDEEIIFHPSFGPNKILGTAEALTGMELKEVTSVFDADGRFSPKFNENNKKTINCDTIIFAVGQMADLAFVKESDKIVVTQRGTIQITDSLSTDAPGIFAGGDVAFGPKNLIDAVANGKKAAVSIDEFLSGQKRTKEYKVTVEVLPQDSYSMIDEYDHKTRSTPPVAEPQNRVGLNEVEFSFNRESAMEQASRCLTCHTSPIYDGDICILCGRCTDICPEYCLSFVSIKDVDMPQAEKDEVLKNLAMNGQEDITVMLKDDEKCIRCGLCSLRCPTGALRMERIMVEEITSVA